MLKRGNSDSKDYKTKSLAHILHHLPLALAHIFKMKKNVKF